MKESIQAAESFVKSRCFAFGIQPAVFESKDIHVHVPEGATPKDGPSAGVAMVTAIVSVLIHDCDKHYLQKASHYILKNIVSIGSYKVYYKSVASCVVFATFCH